MAEALRVVLADFHVINMAANLASGTPAVAAGVGRLPDLVSGEEYGYLVLSLGRQCTLGTAKEMTVAEA